MTIDEYSESTGILEEDFGPLVDPEEQAMLEHIVEFETEMFRLNCLKKYSRLPYKALERMMIDIHGEYWRDAL